MSDLIERLRAYSCDVPCIHCGSGLLINNSRGQTVCPRCLGENPSDPKGQVMSEAAAEITRLTSALAASEEARRAERAAVVRECADVCFNPKWKAKTSCDWVQARTAGLIRALATDADNAALNKLLREARKEGMREAATLIFGQTKDTLDGMAITILAALEAQQ